MSPHATGTAPWWARCAPHTTPRRRPATATDLQSRMKHESPPCSSQPPSARRRTTRQTQHHSTADTSTGSTHKEHGASFPRPPPFPARCAVCGVSCSALRGSDVRAGAAEKEGRRLRQDSLGAAASRDAGLVLHCHVADCMRMVLHLVAGKPSPLSFICNGGSPKTTRARATPRPTDARPPASRHAHCTP